MSKLSEMIARLCPNGVEYKKLGEVLKSIRTGLNPRNNFRLNEPTANNFYVTVKEISSGKLAFSDKTDRVTDEALKIIQRRSCLEYGDVLLSGIGTIGKVAIVEIPTNNFNCSESVYLLKPNFELIMTKYLGYVLETKEIQNQWSKTSVGSTLKGIRKETLENVTIPLPPLPVQREIVQILDNFANLTAELTAELAKRKKQYEHYRDMLLNFTGGGRYDKVGVESGEFRVEWKRLGEIAEIGTGSSNTDEQLDEGKYPFFVRSQDVRWKNEYEYDETAIITSGDGVGVGKIFHYHEGKYALHQRAYRVHVFVDQVLPKYIFYYMKNGFLSYIQKNAFQSSVTSIRKPMLLNFPIPLPPLAEQERIVAILDRFDSLCNSLTEGLPAEIALRKKQYEYYRDKLLSFKEAS